MKFENSLIYLSIKLLIYISVGAFVFNNYSESLNNYLSTIFLLIFLLIIITKFTFYIKYMVKYESLKNKIFDWTLN